MFIALNWPAQQGVRGVPDRTKAFGEVSGPVVWETWKAALETFLPGGADPPGWEDRELPGVRPEIADANRKGLRVLITTSKLSDVNQAGFTRLLGPLIAQNQTYLRFETRFNRTEFEKIRGDPAVEKTKLYLRANLPTKSDPALSFPDNSTEVKAAWIDLEDVDASLADTIVRREALVLNLENNQFEQRTVGLIGLHIVQKTHNRPEWIWSSFEHSALVTGPKRLLNDPSGSQVQGVNVDPDTGQPPQAISKANPAKPKAQRKPVQVVRTRAIDTRTQDTNTIYQGLLKDTIWRNYRLVMTQWPSQPGTPPIGAPFPDLGDPNHMSVANVSVETYVQDLTTCMDCHGRVNTLAGPLQGLGPLKTDFAFTLFNHAYPPLPGFELDQLITEGVRSDTAAASREANRNRAPRYRDR
jgi:hypothetical protein